MTKRTSTPEPEQTSQEVPVEKPEDELPTGGLHLHKGWGSDD